METSAATDRSGDGPRHAAEPAPGTAGSPRHAAEPVADDTVTRVVAPAQTGRVRLTRGGAVALALLLVIGGVLVMFIRQAQSEPGSPSPAAAAPAPSAQTASPAPSAVPAPAPASQAVSQAAPDPAVSPPAALPPEDAATTPAPRLPATGTFEVASTAGNVTVRSQNLGADLYRVTLAGSAAPVTAKVADVGTNHRLTLVKDLETVAPPVTITLNSGIRWGLKLTAGNTETSVNLTQSTLVSLELAGGAHVFDLALPRAAGVLPLRVTHGMNQLKINTGGVPVRMNLRVGAGKVILDGVTHVDTKPGKVLTSDDWADTGNRVDLDSVEGVGTLTVDTD